MGQNKAVYQEKKYRCGNFMDVYIYPAYPVRRMPGEKRRKKRRPTREVQKKLNKRHASEKLARLAHANFTEEDLSLELDFRENPKDKETAMKELQKFLRKVRRRFQKLEKELKYLWVMETTKKGRFHFHLIISGGIDRDQLEKLWGHGWANSRRLQFDRNGLTALSKYMTKSVRNQEEKPLTYRSYNGSKNLIDPEPEISSTRIRSRKRAAELAEMDWNTWNELYPGFEVVDLEPFYNDEYGSIYIFARLRKLEEKPERKGKLKWQ